MLWFCNGFCGHGNEPSGSIKGTRGGFLQQSGINLCRYTLLHGVTFMYVRLHLTHILNKEIQKPPENRSRQTSHTQNFSILRTFKNQAPPHTLSSPERTGARDLCTTETRNTWAQAKTTVCWNVPLLTRYFGATCSYSLQEQRYVCTRLHGVTTDAQPPPCGTHSSELRTAGEAIYQGTGQP